MLKLINGQLQWREADVIALSKVLGEHAAIRKRKRGPSVGRAPWNPALVRSALKHGILVSDKVLAAYDAAREEVSRAKALKRATDMAYPGREKWFPHQRVDVKYMQDMRQPAYLLAHDPGVGKTLEAIGHAMSIDARRILVVCPNSAKEQWLAEVWRWEKRIITTQIVQGPIQLQIRQLASRNQPLKTASGRETDQIAVQWVIAHWESLVHARLGHYAHPWDLVILDEAHHIANRDAKRTETALNLDAAHRLALTAHPYDKHVGELFPILQFLYPHTYTSFWRFVAMHVDVTPKAFGGLDLGEARRPKLLKWELEPFVLRRTKRSVRKHLPSLTRSFRYVELSKKAEREYAKLKKQFFVELEGRKNPLVVPSVLARLTRLRQYLVAPALVGGSVASAKFALILELLEDLPAPPVIFTEFREATVLLEAFLKQHKLKTLTVQGKAHMKKTTAREQIRRFLDGGADALLVVRKAGSESLNMGGFGYGIHLDPPWGPRSLEQSEGRVDRPEEGTGKLVPATFYPCIVKGSYEEKMWKRIEDRHYSFKKVFTVDTLKEMFK